ncbi:MAG: hypothetical protein JXR96_20145 [Deltaproteobacteria bacterium]|nr:hypothetical protein [Deltaproteobacteria bacterium]
MRTLLRSAALLLSFLGACGGEQRARDLALKREIALQREQLGSLEARLASLEADREQLDRKLRALEARRRERMDAMLGLQALAARVLRATGRQALERLPRSERERRTFAILVGAVARSGDASLSEELLPFVEQHRKCFEIADGPDCGCDAIAAELDRCRDVPLVLDRAPAFEACDRVLAWPGLPSSAVCLSRDGRCLRAAFVHQGRAWVSDYPAPAAGRYFPRNRLQLAHCRALSAEAACEADCDPDIETEQECRERCSEEWDRMHGSCFLMPKSLFDSEWNATCGRNLVDRVLKLKSIFRVSYKTVLYRYYEELGGDCRVWSTFYDEFFRLIGRRLDQKEELLPIDSREYSESLRSREPDSLPSWDLRSDRLAKLVRIGLEKGVISRSLGAKALGISLSELKEWGRSWRLEEG